MNRLIIFGEDWGQHPSSTQHLAKHLSTYEHITWVNSVGMRAPSINARDLKRVAQKLTSFATKTRVISQPTTKVAAFEVLNPVVLPWHNNALVNRFNQRQIASLLGPRKAGERRVYWLSLPTAVSMIEIQPQDRVVYYCGDDFYALDGVDASMIKRWEPQLIKRADLILTASEPLLAKMPSEKSQLLEHGVDYALFSTKTQPHPRLNPTRPTVGFYGSISEWVNVDMLAKLATQRPEYDIMLVGEIKTDVAKLRAFNNVIFVDAVEHHQLPSFSQHWHALLMPFMLNAQIQACNPLKLREYLAAGQPIVSTYFPAVEQYSDLVNVIDSQQAFVDAVTNAVEQSEFLRDYTTRKQQERVVIHDWSQRAQCVRFHIQAIL